MYYTVTADTDLTGKGKRCYAWHISNTVAAGLVNLRNGSVTGDIVVQIQVAIGDSKSQVYPGPRGLVFPAGVFVDVVTGTIVGSVDID